MQPENSKYSHILTAIHSHTWWKAITILLLGQRLGSIFMWTVGYQGKHCGYNVQKGSNNKLFITFIFMAAVFLLYRLRFIVFFHPIETWILCLCTSDKMFPGCKNSLQFTVNTVFVWCDLTSGNRRWKKKWETLWISCGLSLKVIN